MNVEQTLTDELRVVAGSLETPPPPALPALVDEARHVRHRTRLRVATSLLAVAAVLAAVVLGTQIGRPTTAPDPVKPSPSYYAPGVPYVLKGVLYIDHTAQSGKWIDSRTAGDHTVAERADQALVIFRDGVEVDTVAGELIPWWDLSDSGAKLSWFTSSDGPAGSLVVRDLSSARELGRLPLPVHDEGDEGFGMSMQVEDDGTVYYQIQEGPWRSWKPGGAPRKATQPSGVRTEQPGFPGIDAWVRLSPDHLWGAWLTDRHGNQLSADQPARGITIQKPGDPESRFTIAFPADGEGSFVDWQTPTRVFVVGGTSDVDCDVVKRRCEKGYAG